MDKEDKEVFLTIILSIIVLAIIPLTPVTLVFVFSLNPAWLILGVGWAIASYIGLAAATGSTKKEDDDND